MTKFAPALRPSAAPALATDFAQAKEYWQGARLAAGQSAAFMVLLGAELERLHKKHGVRAGRPALEINSSSVKELKWSELLEQQVGCSETQAWRAREMFKASRKRVPLLDGPKLLTTSIDKFEPAEREALIKAVSKATDGKSAAEFSRELGISKKEQGSGAKGGNTKKPKSDDGDKDADETPATASDTKIPAGVDPQAWALNTLLEEALKDGWWNDCPADFRRTLHGNLVDAQARVGATLKGAK